MVAMLDLKTALLAQILEGVVTKLKADAVDEAPWNDARRALEEAGEHDAELVNAVGARDLDRLRAILDQWASGKRLLPAQDRAVFGRAMKAYRKTLKVTRLVDESRIGGGPMSSGSASGIVAVTPPPQYPREVWDALVRRGELVYAGRGMYGLAKR